MVYISGNSLSVYLFDSGHSQRLLRDDTVSWLVGLGAFCRMPPKQQSVLLFQTFD